MTRLTVKGKERVGKRGVAVGDMRPGVIFRYKNGLYVRMRAAHGVTVAAHNTPTVVLMASAEFRASQPGHTFTMSPTTRIPPEDIAECIDLDVRWG